MIFKLRPVFFYIITGKCLLIIIIGKSPTEIKNAASIPLAAQIFQCICIRTQISVLYFLIVTEDAGPAILF